MTIRSSSDGRLARARKTLNLVDEHRARVELILGVDDHHDLRVPAIADGDRDQRPREKVAMVILIAGLP